MFVIDIWILTGAKLFWFRNLVSSQVPRRFSYRENKQNAVVLVCAKSCGNLIFTDTKYGRF